MKYIIAIAAIIATAILTPYTASAKGICDNHGVGPGLIYKHACAKGPGNGGFVAPVVAGDDEGDEDGGDQGKDCDKGAKHSARNGHSQAASKADSASG